MVTITRGRGGAGGPSKSYSKLLSKTTRPMRKPLGNVPIEHCFFLLKFLILTWRTYANYAEWLFSLRKRLRGDTLVDPCYSGDYADYAAHLAYTTLYAIRLMIHTNYADYAGKITYT